MRRTIGLRRGILTFDFCALVRDLIPAYSGYAQEGRS